MGSERIQDWPWPDVDDKDFFDFYKDKLYPALTDNSAQALEDSTYIDYINGNLDVNGWINTQTSQYKVGSAQDTILTQPDTSWKWNLFVGIEAGNAHVDDTGTDNTLIGYQAGYSKASGSDNTCIGAYAGYSINGTWCMDNTFVGMEAGYNTASVSSTTGQRNTFIGSGSGDVNTTGRHNTFLGQRSGGASTTGDENVFIGTGAGLTNTTGGSNTCLGYYANVGSNNLTNATAIGNDASVTASNTIQLGDSNVTNVITAGAMSVGSVALEDTNASNYLTLIWNENDTSDRTLNFLVASGTRSLTIEGDSLLDQDLTTDATAVQFAGLGIGASPTGVGIFYAKEPDFLDTPIFERSGRTSDAHWSTVRILATKTTNMGDGFGSEFMFCIQDDGATINPIASVGAVRNGADNSGAITFKTYNAGSNAEEARIDLNGNFGLGTTSFGASMVGGIQIATGTAPSGNVADTFAFYSADQAAGNACPYFRTENGTVVGLNQGLLTTDNVTFGQVTVADGGSINLQEDITFAGATTENLIKFPDNLADALSIKEGSNTYVTFITTNNEENIKAYKPVDVIHTAAVADDHAFEVDADAAAYGDVKAIDVNYVTGAIAMGEDEGIVLLNIDETAATGGDVFGLEVLATDGSAGIYGMKVGAVVGPIHQDSGTFANPTTGTDNTVSTDVAAMIDGSSLTTTAIFENNNEYILIGAATAFEELELILTTGASGAGIKPTFWYSTAGSHQFTQFTPVDGTNGLRNTGVIAWDASDLTSHATNDDTGTYDIKIIRTRASLSTSPVLGYAKVASTTEYKWDKDGNLSIAGLTIAAGQALTIGTTVWTSATTDNMNADSIEDGSTNAIPTLTQETNWTTAYTHSQVAGGNSVHVSTTENTNWDTAYTHSQIGGGNSVHVSTTENTNWDAAYTHVSNNGSDHSYIDQSVVSGSTPTLTGTNFSGIPASALPNADDDSSTKGVCTFDNGDFNATSGVITIEDSGVDHGSLGGLSDVGDHNWAATKTTAAWSKSIGSGGDYADWATMIADMPDLIAHAVTVTIKAGTTLTESCNIKNKHGVTSAATITIQAEKYYPTSGNIPTADSATATTLRDAALATAALGDDYFNGCWVFIVDGTGTDNGFVLITDYVDVTGDVVVASWPGTQPDNTSRYIIVGALIDGGGTINTGFAIYRNLAVISLYGIGINDFDERGIYVISNTDSYLYYCGIYESDLRGLEVFDAKVSIQRSGIVNNNTDNDSNSGGIKLVRISMLYILNSGISDNNQRGILGEDTSYIEAKGNFGDSNGTWGAYAKKSAQIKIIGTECSGSSGNHSDEGTAGTASDDQASAYT